ncbi:magnesium transporter NIPA-domain-containing protein [Paraphysoderma sedebokerense]|nr:magnesium transporter NIPA-domain-containing protein [Paraphysoderma sedebokerense]
MLTGEALNLAAYAFTSAILVAPLGALSVVISAVLGSVFLRERLALSGKIGCALCVLGSVILILHSPTQTPAQTIPEFQSFVFTPSFLAWFFFSIITSIVLLVKVAPRYGNTNALVYISVCSLCGGLSVVGVQGVGSAVVFSASGGESQIKYWFFWVLLPIDIVLLLCQLYYLNKALNLFNTVIVTPVYYVVFTTITLISSAILYQGFTIDPISFTTSVMSFLVICSGVTLLQTSKISVVSSILMAATPSSLLSLSPDASINVTQPASAAYKEEIVPIVVETTDGERKHTGNTDRQSSNRSEMSQIRRHSIATTNSNSLRTLFFDTTRRPKFIEKMMSSSASNPNTISKSNATLVSPTSNPQSQDSSQLCLNPQVNDPSGGQYQQPNSLRILDETCDRIEIIDSVNSVKIISPQNKRRRSIPHFSCSSGTESRGIPDQANEGTQNEDLKVEQTRNTHHTHEQEMTDVIIEDATVSN